MLVKIFEQDIEWWWRLEPFHVTDLRQYFMNKNTKFSLLVKK